MRFLIKVIARAKRPRVEFLSPTSYKVYVSAVREKGKANDAVIKILAEYFRVPRHAVSILSGKSSASKVVNVER